MPTFGQKALGDETFGDQDFGDEVDDKWSKNDVPLLGQVVD